MADATTVGRVLFNKALPEKYRDENAVMDKKGLTALLTRVAEEEPDKYVDILQSVSDISRLVGTGHGGNTSLSLRDLVPPPAIRKLQQEYRARIHTITQDPKLSEKDKSDKIVKFMLPEIEKAQKAKELTLPPAPRTRR